MNLLLVADVTKTECLPLSLKQIICAIEERYPQNGRLYINTDEYLMENESGERAVIYSSLFSHCRW